MGSTIHSDQYQALLELVREGRRKAGLSQSELAERLGRPQSWVSKVEIGERRLDLEELRRVCEALGLDLVKLVRKWISSI